MAAVPFGGGTLDRAGERRTDSEWLEAARADSRATAVLLGRAGSTAGAVPLDGAEPIALLGVEADGTPVWVAQAPDETELTDLRTLAANADGATAGLVAYASAMAFFHRSHAFCGRCGKPMESLEGGHTRRCENGHQVHPRTDPVVIMLVCDGPDRVLMGRQAAWPERRYSALAGFVEPGEDLETAVAREVREEATLEVSDVRYVASQPWPFPTSLMLGFHCDYASGDPVPGDGELEDARWFSRDEVAEAARHDIDFSGGPTPPGDGLIVPPKLAIARYLIETWIRSTA